MHKTNRLLTIASTMMLAVVVAAAFMAPSSRPTMAASSAASQGKSLAATACAGCHGAAMKGGEAGMAPNITSKGTLNGYTKAQFERLLKTGIGKSGKTTSPKMPVMAYSASKADAIYAYLKSL